MGDEALYGVDSIAKLESCSSLKLLWFSVCMPCVVIVSFLRNRSLKR